MSETTLFSIAYEMLQTTNPYQNNLEDFAYGDDDEKTTLIDLVNFCLSNNRGGYRNRSTKNYMKAYNAIADAMVLYLDNFESIYSFRIKTKRIFTAWLKKIQKEYNLGEILIPEELVPEEDMGIAMVKALQDPQGVTKSQLCNKLGVRQERTVQKNLRRLSPDLYEGNQMDEDYEPFHIAGQPLVAKIKVIKGKHGKRSYKTPNTLHPIILQENLLQVENLLKALSLSSNQYNSNISTSIAFDIWSQLSEYAREKIAKDFKYEDKIHQEFLQYLTDDTPNEHTRVFRNQRKMLSEIDATNSDILHDVEKVESRICTLRFKDDKGNRFSLEGVKIRRLNNLDYIAIDRAGQEYLFREEWIGSIIIE